MSNEIDLISNFTINDTIVDLAINQGKTYNKLILKYPADLTTGTFYGQIRNNYFQDGGELLGTFDFYTPTYDPIEEKTTIYPYLTAETTQDIPYTKYQGSGSISTKNCWVYDIEYHTNDNILLIVRGLVQIIPEVTR